jgi:phage host-nuclease inhibitor protein Gam
MKHIKPVIGTRPQAEAALGEVARLTIERNRVQLTMDEAIVAIREAHEGPLASLNKQIESQVELLEGWAAENAEEFGKLKSLEMQHGVLGWRRSTKLKTLAKWTWDRVLEKLESLGNDVFLRVKTEVNKDAIRDMAMSGEIDGDVLKVFGCRLAVEDTFFVEPSLEQPENRVTKEAA